MTTKCAATSGCKTTFWRSRFRQGIVFWAGAIAVVSLVGGCANQLERAIKTGDKSAVQAAVAGGADVNAGFWFGSPASKAIVGNDLKALIMLREAGARLLPTDLVLAAEHGSRGVYPYLVEQGVSVENCAAPSTLAKVFPDDDDIQGTMPPIGVAIARSDLESLRDLVNLGSPLNVYCSTRYARGSFSSILAAATVGDPQTMAYLLEHDAQPNTLRTDGMTPLAIAAKLGHYETARLLLANGAFHTYSQAAKQPIELAMENGHADVVELLGYAGAVAPYRAPQPSKLEKFTNAVIDGAVLVGSVWLLYEGIKYAGYADSIPVETEQWKKPQVEPSAPSRRQVPKTMSGGQSTAECMSDYGCDFGSICVKAPNHGWGVCMRSVDEYGSPARGIQRPESVGPHGTAACLNGSDCPVGYRCDLILKACVK